MCFQADPWKAINDDFDPPAMTSIPRPMTSKGELDDARTD